MKNKIIQFNRTGRVILLFFLFLSFGVGHGQALDQIKWWNPAIHEFDVIEGSGWFDEVEEPFDRLPKRMKDIVRDPVWSLSKHSAGLSISFYTNASTIRIRYVIEGPEDMYHMPSTGVSGMDLFARDSDGDTHWIRGRRSSSDTISYMYSGLTSNDKYHKLGREYTIFLPLYAQTKWMEVGVNESDYFQPVPKRTEKPIVVYGTSIAQGACATRPGTAWTGMLSRKMDTPLLNLGFSGNGRLEPELIELISEIDAKAYILDCLPNLSASTEEEFVILVEKITSAVKSLRLKRPETPIILADHAGYTDGTLQDERQKRYTEVNRALAEALNELSSIDNLFHIPIDKFGQNMETMVDGTHPNDLGMFLYAEGYEEALRKILNEQVGETKTTKPKRQRREPGLYEWERRHRQILEYSTGNDPETIIIGNSITHFWGGFPKGPIRRSPESWNKFLGDDKAVNLGIGWDRIENVLWRVYHGELDNFNPSTIVVLIGTNNLHLDEDEEMMAGYKLLLKAIGQRKPDAELVICGILPRKGQEDRVKNLNEKLAILTEANSNMIYVDPGRIFLDKNGKLLAEYFLDGLHPNEKGYKRLGKELSKLFK